MKKIKRHLRLHTLKFYVATRIDHHYFYPSNYDWHYMCMFKKENASDVVKYYSSIILSDVSLRPLIGNKLNEVLTSFSKGTLDQPIYLFDMENRHKITSYNNVDDLVTDTYENELISRLAQLPT